MCSLKVILIAWIFHLPERRTKPHGTLSCTFFQFRSDGAAFRFFNPGIIFFANISEQVSIFFTWFEEIQICGKDKQHDYCKNCSGCVFNLSKRFLVSRCVIHGVVLYVHIGVNVPPATDEFRFAEKPEQDYT